MTTTRTTRAATTPSGGRRYPPGCPLACALDVLGERWTLLVVRELLLGPKRFTQLRHALPAAGPNRLTTRLRRLRDAGAVDRTGSGAYALTPYGEGLREPVLGLGLWGLGVMPDLDADSLRPDMVALVMSAALPSDLLGDLDLEVEVHTPEPFTLRVDDGRMSVRSETVGTEGASHLTCSARTFVDLALGATTLDAERAVGTAEVEGDDASLVVLLDHVATTTRHLMATR